MKPATEIKILKSFLEIIEDPVGKERSCRRVSLVLYTIGMLCLFYLFSDNLRDAESYYMVVVVSLVSGLCFGLGIWFVQMAFQTKIVTQHMSKKSINERIEEINT